MVPIPAVVAGVDYARLAEFLGGPTISAPRNVPTRVSGTLQSEINRGTVRRRLDFLRTYKGKERARALYRIPYPAPGPRYTSFADTLENARCALLERVFYHEIGGVFTVPIVPDGAVVRDLLGNFRKRLSFLASPLTPVTLSAFAGKYYRGQRFKTYDRAAREVSVRGPRIKDSYLATFLKHEKIPVLSKRAVPRVIQPRHPRYNAQVGCYLRPLEHILYRDIARLFGRPTVMKGFNAERTGEMIAASWQSFTKPVGLGLDASRFDQHVSATLLKWEHTVYELYYPGHELLRRLLSWQVCNRGFVRVPGGTLQYTVEGGRCSGDMNTALGNCLIMCASVYSLLEKLGFATRHKTRVHLYNNGDDCVLIGEEGDILRVREAVVSHFDALGFVMKVEPIVRVLEELVFCQTQPVYDGVKWRMVRDPRVCLSKDLYVADRVCAYRHLKAQLYAIGSCGLSLTGGLPVLQEFYYSLQRHGSKGKAVDHNFLESGFMRLSYGMTESYRLVTDVARVSFCRAFGIVPDLQIAMERAYHSVVPVLGTPRYGEPWEMPI